MMLTGRRERPALPETDIASCFSWLEDPWHYRVIVERESADLVQCISVPDIFGVESRPDTPHDLAAVVRIEIGRWRKAGVNLLAGRRADVRVMEAAHVH